jgi:serine protease Do
MTTSTNSLVAKAKKLAIPTGAVAALILTGSFLFHQKAVHAAIIGVPPMDDNSVSSLVALDNAVEAVAARVTPAVVNVSVTSRAVHEDADGSDGQNDDEDGQGNGQQGPNSIPPALRRFFGQGGRLVPQGPQVEHGIGSGVIISPDGYIVTNNHVVDNATEIRVTLNDRRVLKAKLVGADKLTDLAVIKVNATSLPSIAWGDSGQLHPGQTVLAFGSPFGALQFSVTRGIISALNRPNPDLQDRRKPGDFIQTDAAINPGNSGGPLVNSHGELVGINTWIISGGTGAFVGAGFAIPSQIVRATADGLIKNGAIHHGYLGISMNDVTPENAGFFNLSDATGAIVSDVSSDSPAGKAGLKSGDVLREIDGKKIANGGQLQVVVSQLSPGANINVGILRDGKPQTVKVQVGEFHANTQTAGNNNPDTHKGGKIGVAVNDLSPEMRDQLNVPTQVSGAAIQSVRPASPAEDAGLSPGDIIVEVNRHKVQSAENFVSEVRSTPAGKDILLLVWSRGGTTYRVVHTDQTDSTGKDTGNGL